MNAQTKVRAMPTARATRASTEPASSLGHTAGIAIADLAPKAALGLAIMNLRKASQRIDALGGDGADFRETAAELDVVRWS